MLNVEFQSHINYYPKEQADFRASTYLHFYTVQRGNPLECKCFDLMILECLYCRSIHLHKDHQSKHRYMEVVD